MTGDLACALLLFIGNVGHLGVLSYKVLKFTELEVPGGSVCSASHSKGRMVLAARTCMRAAYQPYQPTWGLSPLDRGIQPSCALTPPSLPCVPFLSVLALASVLPLFLS
jgi:hypothetical protein